jgi:tripartite-type tricarboxylate transporter receptor subunit TctC
MPRLDPLSNAPPRSGIVSRRLGLFTLCAALCCLTAGCHRADGPYPSREIKLVVQAAPGGLSDTVSRFMAGLLERELGVPVVSENRPGASGALAFSYVVRRAANGYTIGHAPVEISIVRTLGYTDVGPDQMSLICLVSRTPAVLVVRNDSPWNNFNEFVDAARASPGSLVLAHSGTGSIWHINALLMERATGMRVTYVPFGGSSASLAALLGGHVDCVVAGTGEAIANVQAGALRPLAVFDTKASDLYPGIPTSRDLGFEFGVPAWSGFFAPEGVPDSILDRLEQAFHKGFETPDWHRLCTERGMEAVFLGRAAFSEFARDQAVFFQREVPELLRLER